MDDFFILEIHGDDLINMILWFPSMDEPEIADLIQKSFDQGTPIFAMAITREERLEWMKYCEDEQTRLAKERQQEWLHQRLQYHRDIYSGGSYVLSEDD